MPQLRKVLILGAAGVGAAVAVLAAPIAAADPSLLPQCEETGGGTYGGQTTECATPGNVQLDTTPQVYPGEDADQFWGFPGYGFGY